MKWLAVVVLLLAACSHLQGVESKTDKECVRQCLANYQQCIHRTPSIIAQHNCGTACQVCVDTCN